MFSHPVLVPALWNSVVITIIGTALNILLTTTAAYVLTRPRLTLKKPIMLFLIAMMLLDSGFVPEYLVVQKLGLMGSKWAVPVQRGVDDQTYYPPPHSKPHRADASHEQIPHCWTYPIHDAVL